MRRAGCRTVFFGIESGSDEVLRVMRKGITAAQARDAVWAAHDAGLEVGAFFILCYPGETDETVLRDPALRRVAAARLPRPLDAVPAAGDRLCASGWRAASRASRGPTAASC